MSLLRTEVKKMFTDYSWIEGAQSEKVWWELYYDIWDKVPSGYLYFEYRLLYHWEVEASEWISQYTGLPWAGKFHICAEIRNATI